MLLYLSFFPFMQGFSNGSELVVVYSAPTHSEIMDIFFVPFCFRNMKTWKWLIWTIWFHRLKDVRNGLLHMHIKRIGGNNIEYMKRIEFSSMWNASICCSPRSANSTKMIIVSTSRKRQWIQRIGNTIYVRAICMARVKPSNKMENSAYIHYTKQCFDRLSFLMRSLSLITADKNKATANLLVALVEENR